MKIKAGLFVYGEAGITFPITTTTGSLLQVT
jgi:hypothetical protein